MARRQGGKVKLDGDSNGFRSDEYPESIRFHRRSLRATTRMWQRCMPKRTQETSKEHHARRRGAFLVSLGLDLG